MNKQKWWTRDQSARAVMMQTLYYIAKASKPNSDICNLIEIQALRIAHCKGARWLPKFERTLCGPVELPFTKAVKSIEWNWPQSVLSLDEKAAIRNYPVAAGLLSSKPFLLLPSRPLFVMSYPSWMTWISQPFVPTQSPVPSQVWSSYCRSHFMEPGSRLSWWNFVKHLAHTEAKHWWTCWKLTLKLTATYAMVSSKPWSTTWHKDFPRETSTFCNRLVKFLESSSFPQIDSELRNYGNDVLGVAAEHYTSVLNHDTLREEFMQFPSLCSVHMAVRTLHTPARLPWPIDCGSLLLPWSGVAFSTGSPAIALLAGKDRVHDWLRLQSIWEV